MSSTPGPFPQETPAHWSETDRAEWIRDTFRAIPPKSWDVCVWVNGNYVVGTIDEADAHNLIDQILGAVS